MGHHLVAVAVLKTAVIEPRAAAPAPDQVGGKPDAALEGARKMLVVAVIFFLCDHRKISLV
jgi:hypothetical protein